MQEFFDADEAALREKNKKLLLNSASYVLAYNDFVFLNSADARPFRMQLEVVKPEQIMKAERIRSTVIVFGSARLVDSSVAQRMLDQANKNLESEPDNPAYKRDVKKARTLVEFAPYYDMARDFAQIVSRFNQQIAPKDGYANHDFVICTGGGPGIMEAANRGAYDVGARSIGLNIKLPVEQYPNPYISNEFCFQFHYFGIRKLHFMLRAKALVVFPGGFGTFDELFEGLTLRQTHRMQQLPIILFAEDYWRKAVNFDYLVESGMIAEEDLDLFVFVKTPEEAWNAIMKYHKDHNDPIITEYCF
ncbi:MAG: LOG family protein [Planctomycetaceae bacterium]|jgi:uncharacterized protein (TIGR00730 family)|nr:LOG family protein [Planctomycetaceae bacterium]